MTKISEQLDEEKKKSVIELERKMRQRRMQRERTVMELVRTQFYCACAILIMSRVYRFNLAIS